MRNPLFAIYPRFCAAANTLIHERSQVRETDIRTMLEERKRIAEKLE